MEDLFFIFLSGYLLLLVINLYCVLSLRMQRCEKRRPFVAEKMLLRVRGGWCHSEVHHFAHVLKNLLICLFSVE